MVIGGNNCQFAFPGNDQQFMLDGKSWWVIINQQSLLLFTSFVIKIDRWSPIVTVTSIINHQTLIMKERIIIMSSHHNQSLRSIILRHQLSIMNHHHQSFINYHHSHINYNSSSSMSSTVKRQICTFYVSDGELQ